MKIITMMLLIILFPLFFAKAGELKQISGAEKSKTVGESCFACHGVDGNSSNSEWPNLAGQGELYLVKQLMDYRDDKRQDPVMSAMAKAIKSNEEVLILSSYFSALPVALGETEDKKNILEGESIYRGGISESGVAACSSCHGPTGSGNLMAKFPLISGQHSKYIIAQLQLFKSGERKNDPSRMMRNVAEKMTTSQIEAVAEYISGLSE